MHEDRELEPPALATRERLERLAPCHRDPRAGELEHHASAPLRWLERELKGSPIPGPAFDALELGEPLCARLGLPGARTGAEPADEPLQPLDLRLLALDR